MDTNEIYKFRSRADIEAVKKKRERINVRYALIGVGMMVIYFGIDGTSAIIWGKTPITTLLGSKYRWDIYIVIGVVAAVCFYFYDKTKMKQREVKVYRAARVADAFTKAELLLDSGLKQGSVRMVRRELKKLEAVRDSFNEMEEYRELVANGRAWLREHEKKG